MTNPRSRSTITKLPASARIRQIPKGQFFLPALAIVFGIWDGFIGFKKIRDGLVIRDGNGC